MTLRGLQLARRCSIRLPFSFPFFFFFFLSVKAVRASPACVTACGTWPQVSPPLPNDVFHIGSKKFEGGAEEDERQA